MGAQKMLILFILYISSVTSDPFFPRNIVSGYQWRQNLLSKSNPDNVINDCVCFDKSQLPVTKVLIGNENTLKRLVVYLYKDTETNTLQVYAPNKEKQVQFPDLGFEDGDLFKVGVETLHEVFDSNHNVVNVNHLHNHNEGDYSTSTPQNNGLVNPEAAPSYESDIKVGNHENNVDDAATDSSDSDLVSNENQQTNSRAAEEQNYSSSVPNRIIGAAESFNQYQNTVNEHVDKALAPDFIDVNNQKGFLEVKLPLVDLQSGAYPPELNEDVVYSPKTFPVSSEDYVPPAAEKEGQQSTSQHSSHDSYSASRSQAYQQSKVSNSKNYLIQEGNQESAPGSKSHLHTIAVDDYIQSGVDRVGEGTNSSRNQYVTFDLWFTQQMQKIQKTGNAPNKNIDVSSLKHLIEKTLYENGLFVTSDGVLTDSKANVLSVANLKLRPFLIGDSVEYNNIFAENKGDKFEVPSNLPYLESVLVTLVDPPKILGVIPLGKTFLPRISYRTGLDYWAWKARNNMDECRSWHCNLEKLKEHQYYWTLASKQHRLENLPHMVQINPSPPEITREGTRKPHKNGKKGSVNKSGEKQRKEQKYQYRVNFNNVLEAVKHALFKHKPADKYNKGNTHTKNHPELPHKDVDDTSEEDEEEELPGFRIIGGWPGTSSGTPVSSKGRSGKF